MMKTVSLTTFGCVSTLSFISLSVSAAIELLHYQTKAEKSDLQRYIVQFAEPKVALAQGELQVMSQGQLSPMAIEAFAQSVQGQVELILPSIGGAAISMKPTEIQSLSKNAQIKLIEVDPKRYLLAEETPYGITMVQAPEVSDANASNKKVCIMDTGYDLEHEDLMNSGITGDDGYGSHDTGDWFNDGHGHGTHVAGTIAAVGNNNKGVVGVNPSGTVGLHIVKVFDDDGRWAYGSNLIAAIDQCKAAGSDVISMSLGGSGSSQAEGGAFQQALDAGILSIAAAGNSGNSNKSYPASYDAVMSVAAVDSSEKVASFSQYNNQVEIAAPGVSVKSTLPNNRYAAWSGTSMATPHVSGVAALVWSNFSECSVGDIRQALNTTAKDKGDAGRDNKYGWGIVQAKSAYDHLSATTDCGEPPNDDDILKNGKPVRDLAGDYDSMRYWKMAVPAGATSLSFETAGGEGDVDLYVKRGSKPTLMDYDCRPFQKGNDETCNFTDPQSGDWYVMLRGYRDYKSVTLVGKHDADGDDRGGETHTDVSGAKDGWVRYEVTIPAGATSFNIETKDGTGDADLYVRKGAEPTTGEYDCRPYKWGNAEQCSFSNPDAGKWYIGVRGYAAFEGLTVSWTYE